MNHPTIPSLLGGSHSLWAVSGGGTGTAPCSRKTVLQLPSGGPSEIEEFVIEKLRDLIQVKGTVQLNDQGEPDRIVDVYEIVEVDFKPLKLSKADYNWAN